MVVKYYTNKVITDEKIIHQDVLNPNSNNYRTITSECVDWVDESTVDVTFKKTSAFANFSGRGFLYILADNSYPQIYSHPTVVYDTAFAKVVRWTLDWKYTSFHIFLQSAGTVNLIVERQSKLNYRYDINQIDPNVKDIVDNVRMNEDIYEISSSTKVITNTKIKPLQLGIWYVVSKDGIIWLLPLIGTSSTKAKDQNYSYATAVRFSDNVVKYMWNNQEILDDIASTESGFIGKYYGPSIDWFNGNDFNESVFKYPHTSSPFESVCGLQYKNPIPMRNVEIFNTVINGSYDSVNNPEIKQYESLGLGRENVLKPNFETNYGTRVSFRPLMLIFTPNGFEMIYKTTNQAYTVPYNECVLSFGEMLPTATDQYMRWYNENQSRLHAQESANTMQASITGVLGILTTMIGLALTATGVGAGLGLGMVAGGLAATGGSITSGVSTSNKIAAEYNDAKRSQQEQKYLTTAKSSVQIAKLFNETDKDYKYYLFIYTFYRPTLDSINYLLTNSGAYTPNVKYAIPFSNKLRGPFKITNSEYNSRTISNLEILISSWNASSFPEQRIKNTVYEYLKNGVNFI